MKPDRVKSIGAGAVCLTSVQLESELVNCEVYNEEGAQCSTEGKVCRVKVHSVNGGANSQFRSIRHR